MLCVLILMSTMLAPDDPYIGTDPAALINETPVVDRRRAIQYLQRLLRTPDEQDLSRGTRCGAAHLLGLLRAPESARILLDNLELRSFSITRIDPLAQHCAAQALVDIGSNCYPHVYHYVSSNELSDKKIKILGHIIKGIDGREVGLARVRHWLEDHVSRMREHRAKTGEDQTNRTLTENLNRLIELLARDDLEKAENWPMNWRD